MNGTEATINNNESSIHPLAKSSIFTYEFLSIHPFQDGNGRLSRLISSLLLLKNGYKWIEYISFEHEIEIRKLEYYRVLRNCQAQRPNENISEWVNFFFDALKNIQGQLMQKLQIHQAEGEQLQPREKLVVSYIQNHPGCKSGDIAKGLGISRNDCNKTPLNLNRQELNRKAREWFRHELYNQITAYNTNCA